jgi:hypothetical protein
MIETDNIQTLGQGLWYLPTAFDLTTYREIRQCYRETTTGWQCLYPNRIMSLPNNPHYTRLAEIAEAITPQVSNITGYHLTPLNQEIFLDLPGHQLTWHFDHDNYRVLLQVYTGDLAKPSMGTRWYLGPRNQELFNSFGADSIVNVAGLEVTETPYAPNAGYINDNTQKKAHGTKAVPMGLVRESVLFTFK